MTLSTTSHQVQNSSKATKIYVLVIDLNNMLTNQVQAWVDATDDKGLEEVRSTPTINNNVDQQMICDFQHAVGRLIGKASQLIGMKNSIFLIYFFYYVFATIIFLL